MIMSLLATIQSDSASAELFFILVVSVAFPMLWCLVVSMIAKVGGWQTLAKTYRIERYPARPRQKGGRQTIYIDKARYKGAATIHYDIDGLYMHTIFLFRIGHPLLYIPWSDVTVHPKTRNLFGFDFNRELTFSQEPEVRVVFPKRLIERFEYFRGVQMM